MKANLAMLAGMMLFASAAWAATEATPSVEEIGCFSDSPEGTEMARAAARFLADRRQAGFYSKSFVATEREDKDSSRYLILILSPDGEKAFGAARQEFDDALLALLQRMKKHFGDDKVEVILQRPDKDKSNLVEAYFDSAGAGALKGFSSPVPPPGRSPSPAAAGSPSTAVPAPPSAPRAAEPLITHPPGTPRVAM